MSKSIITRTKGFTTADATLPPNVTTLGAAPDGIYIVLADHTPKPNYDRLPTLKKGTIVYSTAGGHMYCITLQGQLQGLGKGSRRGCYPLALVQRIRVTNLEIGAYKPRAPRKKVAKKTVAKRK